MSSLISYNGFMDFSLKILIYLIIYQSQRGLECQKNGCYIYLLPRLLFLLSLISSFEQRDSILLSQRNQAILNIFLLRILDIRMFKKFQQARTIDETKWKGRGEEAGVRNRETDLPLAANNSPCREKNGLGSALRLIASRSWGPDVRSHAPAIVDLRALRSRYRIVHGRVYRPRTRFTKWANVVSCPRYPRLAFETLKLPSTSIIYMYIYIYRIVFFLQNFGGFHQRASLSRSRVRASLDADLLSRKIRG